MPFNPNSSAPRISLGNWISGGSLLYIPPSMKKKLPPANPTKSPKKIESPKEEKKNDAPKSVSEGTDSPEDVAKKAKEAAEQAEADAKKAQDEAKKMTDEQTKVAEEAAKKKADEEAAAKKKAEDEETEKKKKEDEESALKKQIEDHTSEIKKKLEELVDEKQFESHRMEIKQRLGELAKEMAKGEASVHKARSHHGRYCSNCGRRRHEGECDTSPIKAASTGAVVNVNVYSGPDDTVKVTGNEDKTLTGKKSDGSSTSTTSNDKNKSPAKSNTKPTEDANFTKEEDEKLLSLKKGGTSWLRISRTLGISSKYCIQRFQELSGDAVSSVSSDKESSLPEGHVDLGEIVGVTIETKDGDAEKGDPVKKAGDDKMKNQKKAGSDISSNNSQKSSNYKKPSVEDVGKTTASPKNGNPINESKNDSESNQNKNATDTPADGSRSIDSRTYIPISLAATIPLSEGRRHLEPDATWTIKDLECLAEIECRYRELKWMKLSADFFNHTGRLIAPALIQAKIMEATLPEEQKKEDSANQDLHIEVDLKDIKKIKRRSDIPNKLDITIAGSDVQNMLGNQ